MEVRSNTDNKNCFSDDHESTVFLNSVKVILEKVEKIRQITSCVQILVEMEKTSNLSKNVSKWINSKFAKLDFT